MATTTRKKGATSAADPASASKPAAATNPNAPPPMPMVSVAGIRGTLGGSLRAEDFFNYAQAFMAPMTPRKLVLGRDTRASGEMLRHMILGAAIACGVEVHDLGVVPTPTVGFMVRKLKAGGGIMLSASHNPPEWNALKFFSETGSFLEPAQLARILEIYERRAFHRAPLAELGRVVAPDPKSRSFDAHLNALLETLPVEAIRRRKFVVALDACNGAGLDISLALFKALGARVEVILSKQDGRFERVPEPLPENLGKLKKKVVEMKADIGFALDPDADRLAIVDETGRAIGEERTIALAAEYVLRGSKRPVVVNLSTTRAVEDVAARHGGRVERTAIGEAHVVKRMRELKADIGGEGNGGVIFPRVHPGRDSASGMGLILAALVEAGEEGKSEGKTKSESGSGSKSKSKVTLSDLNARIPDYVMIKDKIDLPDRSRIAPALARIRLRLGELAAFEPAPDGPAIDETDGLKISMAEAWLHVRASGTEPIMRLFSEAPTKARGLKLVEWAKKLALE